MSNQVHPSGRLAINTFLLILAYALAGCYTVSPLSQTRRWMGPDVFVITDTIKVPMEIRFHNVSKHTSDSLFTVEGTVRDSSTNEALAGAFVLDRLRWVNGRELGTTTDYLSRFKLNGVGIGDTLWFKDIGYASKTVFVGDVVNRGRRTW